MNSYCEAHAFYKGYTKLVHVYHLFINGNINTLE